MTIFVVIQDYMEDYEVFVPSQSLQDLEFHVDAICRNKSASDTCPTDVHDFEGTKHTVQKRGMISN